MCCFSDWLILSAIYHVTVDDIPKNGGITPYQCYQTQPYSRTYQYVTWILSDIGSDLTGQNSLPIRGQKINRNEWYDCEKAVIV